MDWVKYVYLGFESSPASDNEDFQKTDTPTYTPPKATTTADGGRQVGLWIQAPSGMLPENSYYYLTMEFDNHGHIKTIDHNQRFSVKFKGYE